MGLLNLDDRDMAILDPDSTVADAILDRLVHNAYRFELKGPTKRRIDKNDKHGKKNKITPVYFPHGGRRCRETISFKSL